MRLIGILIALAIVAYISTQYLESSRQNSGDNLQSRPKELIDQTKQSVDQLNSVLKKQQQQIEKEME